MTKINLIQNNHKTSILLDLVHFKNNIDALKNMLSQIGFEDEKTQEMIFKLANPYLYGKLDEKQVLSYLNELDEKCGDKYKIVNVLR